MKTLDQRMAEWQTKPGRFVTKAEQKFINDMRQAALDGVGYGWMQQIIGWEWQSIDPKGALVPK